MVVFRRSDEVDLVMRMIGSVGASITEYILDGEMKDK